MKRALKRRQHVVFELAYPGIAKPFAEIARKQGYVTELTVLSVNRFVSFASTVERHGGKTESTIISFREHRRAYDAWLAYLVEAENRGYFDEVRVVSRDRVFYRNHLVLRDGAVAWNASPDGFGVLATSRYGELSLGQMDWLRAIWQAISASYRHEAFESEAHFLAERKRLLDFIANGPWKAEPGAAREWHLPEHAVTLIAEELRHASAAAKDMDAPNYGDLSKILLARLGRPAV